jgi:endo-1,4-beta-xylanase
MNITRRQSLAYGLGAAALAALPSLVQALGANLRIPLNAIAQAKGMRFGSAAAYYGGGGVTDPHYAALHEAECGLLVPENEMKWQALRPSPTKFAFEAFDGIMAYAESEHLPMRGHNLLWNRPKWQPRWLNDYDFGAHPASEAARLLTTHIHTVIGRYKGRIHSYDVVNETVLPEDGSLAETALSKALGGTEMCVDLAFHTARAAAPDTQLVYNDYMSWESGNEKHRAGVLRLLEGLRKRNVPVDALGVQSHLIAQHERPQERAWRQFIDEVVGMGYGLLITEFDVRDGAFPRNITKRDAEVAALAKSYLDMMFSYSQLRDVLVWGLCDRFSWLQGFEPRKDGAETRGCLYDDRYAAKPLRQAFVEAFKGARKR